MIDSHLTDIGDLLPDLQALGFSEYEARAYVALFKLQTATAYEVSKLAGLPKANSYAVLESLSKKEAAQPVSESPVRYVAVAPAVLFKRIANTTDKRCARLAGKISSLAQSDDRGYVWSISGEEAIADKVQSMIEAATSHIWIKAEGNMLEPHRAALQEAANRGVAIMIILFGADLKRFSFGKHSRTYLHEGNGVVVGIAHQLMTITKDFEEAFVAEFRGEPRGAHTMNRAIVNLADTLLRHEIYFAEIFEAFGESIQETFGPALIKLRRKYLPRDQVAALESLLGGGSSPARHRKNAKAGAR
jgi:HTH-type transcriptional regulator, sugar sensing transcriptional regulator